MVWVRRPRRQAIIVPVKPTYRFNRLTLLVSGVAALRIYDRPQVRGINLHAQSAVRHVLASVILYESEVYQNWDEDEAAAQEQPHLKQQLNVQASRMRRTTELLPLGTSCVSSDGVLLEANKQSYEMTRDIKEPDTAMSQSSYITKSGLDVIN